VDENCLGSGESSTEKELFKLGLEKFGLEFHIIAFLNQSELSGICGVSLS
jgi:hypothetical protein